MYSVHIQQYHLFVRLPKDEVVICYLNMSASLSQQEENFQNNLNNNFSSVFLIPIHQ